MSITLSWQLGAIVFFLGCAIGSWLATRYFFQQYLKAKEEEKIQKAKEERATSRNTRSYKR